MYDFGRALIASAILVAACAGEPVFAETPQAGRNPDPDPAEAARTAKEPTLKPEDVAKRLAEAQRVLEAARSAGGEQGDPPAQLLRQVELLKQLEVDLAQQAAARERQTERGTAKQDLNEKIDALRVQGPTETRPFSFLLLDRLREELNSELARDAAYVAAETTAEDSLRRAKVTLAEKERQRRHEKEAAETNQDDSAAPRLALAVALAELESTVAQEVCRLREFELANERLAHEVQQIRIIFLREKTDCVAKDSAFTKADLQDQLSEIDVQEFDVKRDLERKQTNLDYLQKRWFESRQRLDQADVETPALSEEIEADHLALQTQQQEIATLNQRLQRLGEMQSLWNRRFKIITGGINDAERSAWRDETERALEQLNREARLQATMIDEHRKDLATLDGKRQAVKQQSPQLQKSIDEQGTHLHNLIQVREMNLVSIETSRRLYEKLLAELRQGEAVPSPAAQWLASTALGITQVWNYEITSVDDKPITVRKIINGLILFCLGFLFSRFLSRMFGRRFLPRLGFDESAAAALQAVGFYLLITTFTLFALRLVNVPLTVFTVLGGAVALGVGFGSQNILNNFISGLILLAERPVRVGDLIQFNEQYGVVEEIGPRSTRVITAANLEVIVPNSSLLESNVINWTLSNKMVRRSVRVGVAYGSPVRELSRLLKHAADESGLVLRNPEPFVFFTDFAESALNFELHFWIHMSTITEHQRIESDLRFRIAEVLAEAGISMPFPQRDVHLQLAKPLEVRLDLPEQGVTVVRNAA